MPRHSRFSVFTFPLFLNRVKTLAEDTLHVGHRHEGLGVYPVNEVEDVLALEFLGQYQKDGFLLLAVPTMTFQNGTSSLQIVVYARGYLLVLVRDDDETGGFSKFSLVN